RRISLRLRSLLTALTLSIGQVACSRHPNPKAAELELRLEEGLNRLGIGPQGLTGNSSVMGVHIESAARHPSTIGVAVSTGCWAHRRGTLLVHADLTFENLSHTRSAL
ncbi:fumarate hydratase, partial [Escherichia coli]|nr:fumarate hydratase [Escherichia coli]